VGELALRTPAALDLLTSIRPDSSDISSEIGQRGDAAYLRICTTGEPDRWAVVSSPGDRWFSLEVDGGFSLDHFEEDTPDGDADRRLREYVDAAVQYLRTGAATRRTRIFGIPTLTISTEQGDVMLRKSLTGVIGQLVGIRRQR
jgi:hypothetical protein